MSAPPSERPADVLSSADKRKVAAEAARAALDASLAAVSATSPWLTLREGSAYAKRGRRVLRKAVQDGRLRGAVCGDRKALIFKREWIDGWLEDLSTPVLLPARRRA